MTETFTAVCSNKPRPSVHTGRNGGQFKTGACLWGRDIYHAASYDNRTLCGKNCTEYLKIEDMNRNKALNDDNFCKRCAVKINEAKGER